MCYLLALMVNQVVNSNSTGEVKSAPPLNQNCCLPTVIQKGRVIMIANPQVIGGAAACCIFPSHKDFNIYRRNNIS